MGRGFGIYSHYNRAKYQHAWEQNSGTVPVRVSLEPEIVAILDQVAIDLYEQHPHDPRNNVLADITPSRAEAIRVLAREHWEKRERRKTPPFSLRKLRRLRAALADFWRAEASYRRNKTGYNRSGDPVLRLRPPWK